MFWFQKGMQMLWKVKQELHNHPVLISFDPFKNLEQFSIQVLVNIAVYA